MRATGSRRVITTLMAGLATWKKLIVLALITI